MEITKEVNGKVFSKLLSDETDETDRPLSEQARADLAFGKLLDERDRARCEDHNSVKHRSERSPEGPARCGDRDSVRCSWTSGPLRGPPCRGRDVKTVTRSGARCEDRHSLKQRSERSPEGSARDRHESDDRLPPKLEEKNPRPILKRDGISRVGAHDCNGRLPEGPCCAENREHEVSPTPLAHDHGHDSITNPTQRPALHCERLLESQDPEE